MEKLKITVDDKGQVAIFMDGQRLKGIRKFEFTHEAGFPASHTVEFVTQKGGVGDGPERPRT